MYLFEVKRPEESRHPWDYYKLRATIPAAEAFRPPPCSASRTRPAFRCFGQTLTYADTDRLSRQFAAYLQASSGVKKGDRIAVMLPNIPAFPLAMLGIVRAGAVQVNVNPLYTPRELEHQLNDAGVETIVIFNGVSATLAEIIGKTAVKQVISVGLGDGTGAALPSPPVDARLAERRRLLRCPGAGRELAFTPVRVVRRRSALPAIYRRDHGPLEGRRAVAPQPGRQHRAVQGVHGGCHAPRPGRWWSPRCRSTTSSR